MNTDDLKDRLRAATEQAANEFEAVAEEIVGDYESLRRKHAIAVARLANCHEELARLEAENEDLRRLLALEAA